MRAGLLGLIVLCGCGDDGGAAPEDDAGTPVDTGTPADTGRAVDSPSGLPDAGPGAWTVAETLTDDGTILIERVDYPSGDLRITGQVCRPAGDGPFPLLVLNHGGFEGLGGDWNGGACAAVARNLRWAVV